MSVFSQTSWLGVSIQVDSDWSNVYRSSSWVRNIETVHMLLGSKRLLRTTTRVFFSTKNEKNLNKMAVTYEDISLANFRIRDGVLSSSCKKSSFLSKSVGMEMYLKKDYQQATGSFKERGARNALLLCSDKAKLRGVIAASAGNHALALAYHGQDLNIPVTCIMPTIAPLTKISNCRELGANVILHGNHILEARDHASFLSEEEELMYINGFDHPHIIAGAGTMALEMLQQVV